MLNSRETEKLWKSFRFPDKNTRFKTVAHSVPKKNKKKVSQKSHPV